MLVDDSLSETDWSPNSVWKLSLVKLVVCALACAGDIDEETWRQISRLAKFVKFHLTANNSAVESAGARNKSLDHQIELSYLNPKFASETAESRIRLALQSNMNIRSLFYEESEDIWDLIWAAPGYKRVDGYCHRLHDCENHWYCNIRPRFFDVADQLGWVYGEGTSRRFYLPIENPRTLIQLCQMPGNESILQARSISFLGAWTNVDISIGYSYEDTELVFPHLEELYLNECVAAGQQLNLETMAPNLNLLHFAPGQDLDLVQLANHPTLEHLVLDGNSDFRQLATLSRMPSLKRLTLTSEGLVGAGDDLRKQAKRLEKMLRGIEIQVVPDATHLAPPDHFVRHRNQMRQRVLRKRELSLER